MYHYGRGGHAAIITANQTRESAKALCILSSLSLQGGCCRARSRGPDNINGFPETRPCNPSTASERVRPVPLGASPVHWVNARSCRYAMARAVGGAPPLRCGSVFCQTATAARAGRVGMTADIRRSRPGRGRAPIGPQARSTPSFLPTAENNSSPLSRSRRACAAEIITRIRAFPFATVG